MNFNSRHLRSIAYIILFVFISVMMPMFSFANNYEEMQSRSFSKEIIELKLKNSDSSQKTVKTGTAENQLNFPEEIVAILANGQEIETINISVSSWTCESNYEAEKSGSYIFTPELALNSDLVLSQNINYPKINITVDEKITEIDSQDNFTSEPFYSNITPIPYSAFDGSTLTLTSFTGSQFKTAVDTQLKAFYGISGAGTVSAEQYNSVTTLVLADNTPTGVATQFVGIFIKNNLKGLKTLDLTNQYYILGDYAFNGCTNIEKVIFAPGMQIGRGSFQSCANLTTLVNLDKVYNFIKPYAFGTCPKLDNVVLPVNSQLGEYAFMRNYALKNITNVESAIGIAEGVFTYCSALESITLPVGITINQNLFMECTSLKTVNNLDKVASSIGFQAFFNCKNLTKISLPDNVSLSEAAFKGCSNLDEIVWGNGVTAVGKDAFTGCALDLTDISKFPALMSSSFSTKAANQYPKMYFSLPYSSASIFEGDSNFVLPAPTISTKYGTNYHDLFLDKASYASWLNQAIVDVPNISSAGSYDINTPDVYTINFFIPLYSAINTNSLDFVLTINPIIHVDEVLLNKNSLVLKTGNSEQLAHTLSPSNSNDSSVTWSSSDTSVATVDSNGNVVAVGPGTANIICTSNGSGVSATCVVNVNQPVIGISLNKGSLNIQESHGEQLIVDFQPSNASNKKIIWRSSDPNVATVDENGNIFAVGAGNATISATTEDGGFVASSLITVVKDDSKNTATPTELVKGKTANTSDNNKVMVIIGLMFCLSLISLVLTRKKKIEK